MATAARLRIVRKPATLSHKWPGCPYPSGIAGVPCGGRMAVREGDAVCCERDTRHWSAREDYEPLLKATEFTWAMLCTLLPDGVALPAGAPPAGALPNAPAPPPAARAGPEYLSAAELLAKEFPASRPIVPGVLHEGLTILAGRPKLGKSWLALGIGVAVAAGGVALGTVGVDGGDVLYLALEDGQRRLQKRLTLLLGDQPPPARLTLTSAYRLLDEGGLDDLELWLAGHPDARLVVVDTLKRFRPREKSGGSIYNLDYDALAPLADLAHRFPQVCILVIHHCRKADAEDPLDLISGTTGLTGAADGAIVLKRARGAPDAELHVTHRDADDAELALKWDDQLSGWRHMGDAEAYRRSDERTAILLALHDAPEPQTPKDVAEVLGKPYGAIKFLMWDMAKQGDLKAEHGRYTPVAPRPPTPTPTEPTNPTNPANPTNSANPTNPSGSGGESGSRVSGVSRNGPVPLTQIGGQNGHSPGAEGPPVPARVSRVSGVSGTPAPHPWTLCFYPAHAGTERTTAHGEVCGTCHPAPWQGGR